MSKLTTDEMMAMRSAGKGAREIAEAAGISHTAVLKRLKRADKAAAGSQTDEVLRGKIIEALDPGKLSDAQKLSALRTLSKSRKRTVGSVDAELKKFLDGVVGRSFTEGAPQITEDEAKRFFMSIHNGTWTPPDLSAYRITETEEEATDEA